MSDNGNSKKSKGLKNLDTVRKNIRLLAESRNTSDETGVSTPPITNSNNEQEENPTNVNPMDKTMDTFTNVGESDEDYSTVREEVPDHGGFFPSDGKKVFSPIMSTVHNSSMRSDPKNNASSFVGTIVSEQWGGMLAKLTKEQVHLYLKDHAASFTLETAKSIEKTLIARIESTDIGAMKTVIGSTNASTTRNTTNIEEVGRLLYDRTIRLVKDCGNVFYHVVITNYDVAMSVKEKSYELSLAQNETLRIENAIQELVSETSYSHEMFKAKAEIDTKEKLSILRTYHFYYWISSALTSAERDEIRTTYHISDVSQLVQNLTKIEWKRPVWDLQKIAELHSAQVREDKCYRIRPELQSLLVIFLRSKYYKDYYEIEESILREKIQDIFLKQYVDHCDHQSDKSRRVLQLRETLNQNKRDSDILKIITCVQNGFTTAITMIVGKLKSAVANYPEIISRLQSTVQLQNMDDDQIGEVIHNPYHDNNLAGMLENLRVAFVEANIVTFKNKLMEALNFRLPKDQMEDPQYGIQSLNQRIYVWKSMQLFQYLTEDIFWTVHFLRMYPPDSEIYKEALRVSMDYIHKVHVEKKDIPNEAALIHPGMPILSHLVTWITKVYAPTKNFSNGRRRGDYNNRGSTSQQNNTNYNNSKYNSEYGYAAIDPNIANATIVSGKYSKIITREDNLCILDNNGRRKFYTATEKPCEMCKNRDDNTHQRKGHASPFCYTRQCAVCKLYGHHSNDCHQYLQAVAISQSSNNISASASSTAQQKKN